MTDNVAQHIDTASNLTDNRRSSWRNSMETPVAHVTPARYVTVALAAAITGLSEKAIRRKIEDGKWIEGREFMRSPDGGIFISVKGYERWVERAGV